MHAAAGASQASRTDSYQESIPTQKDPHVEKSSDGASVEFVLKFSSQDGRNLEEVSQSLAIRTGEIFSLTVPKGRSQPEIKFTASHRAKFKMMAPPTMNIEEIKRLLQPQGDMMKQFRDLCDKEKCQYKISAKVRDDSTSVEEKAEASVLISSPFPPTITRALDELSSDPMNRSSMESFRRYLEASYLDAFSPEQLSQLESLLQMNLHERYLNLAAGVALDANEQKVIFGFPALVPIVAGTITVTLAKEFPQLCTPHGIYACTELVDVYYFSQLRGHRGCIPGNFRRLCSPHGVRGLQEHLFTFEEALFLRHLPSLLTDEALLALSQGTISIQEYDGRPIPATLETKTEASKSAPTGGM